MSTLTDLRLKLLANGYTPLPAVGKKPLLPEWSTRAIGATDIDGVGKSLPPRPNTGVRNPGLDVDIKDPEAAEAVRQEVNDWFGDRGALLRRVGKAPKFLVPFRVKAPFGVINQGFEAPNGEPHSNSVFVRRPAIHCRGRSSRNRRPVFVVWRARSDEHAVQ